MRYLFLLAFLTLANFCANAQQLRPNWVDDLGGTSGSTNVTAIAADKQNNIYITGYFVGTVDFDPSSGVKNLTSLGSTDIFIGKYKQDGTLIWVEQLGGIGGDESNGIAVDNDGNVSIVGSSTTPNLDLDPGSGIDTTSNPIGNKCLLLIHFDTNGNFLWGKPYLIPPAFTFPTHYTIDHVATDSKDGVIITFQFGAPLTIGDTTYSDQPADQGLIVKYNAAGNELWAVNIAGDDVSSNEGTYDVKTDSQDNIVVSGTFGSTINFNPLGTPYNLTAANSNFAASYVAKYSPAGILIWANAINYPATTFIADSASAISIDKQDNVYFSTAFTGFATFGSTTLNATGSGNNVCIAKYSSAGVLQFAKSIGGTGSLGLDDEMAGDTANNLYLTGNLSGTVNFNPNTGTADNLTAHGPQDFYVAKYDALGNYVYAFSAGNAGCANTSGNSLAIDAGNNINIAGSFCSTVNFDQSGCSSDNVTATGATDGFIAQYGTGGIANNIITAPAITGFCTTGTPGAITGSLPTGGGTYTYQWQSSADSVTFININGATAQNYTPPTLSATTYYQRIVSATGGCGAVTPLASNIVSLTIASSPAVPVAPGDTTCAGSVTVLSITSPQTGVTYNWYTGATGDTILFTGTSFTTPALTATTTYYVAATNSTGCSSATRTATTVTVLQVLSAPAVTVASTTSSTIIFSWAAVPGATGYEVSTDNGETYVTPSSGTTGLIDSVGGLLSGQSTTIMVKAIGVIPCQLSPASTPVTGMVTNNTNDIIFVANAFTPNGDGRNDVLHVLGPNIQSLKFTIYDQWGELLFTSTSTQNGWDGTYKGKKEPVGVYVYDVEAVMIDGTNVKKKGTVAILK